MRLLTMCLLLVTASTVSVSAIPNQGTTRIKGTLVDSNNAVITGVQITFRTGDRKTRVLSGKETGIFEIDLVEGVYQVEIERYGFKKLMVTNLEVMIGMTEDLRFQLEPVTDPLCCPIVGDLVEQIEKVYSPLPEKIKPRKIQ